MFGAIGEFITPIIIVVVILFVLSICIRAVSQAQILVVRGLGTYLSTYSVGTHSLAPFIDRVVKKINLGERVENFPPQLVIAKGNATMQVDTVVFFYITDPKLYACGVKRPLFAIENSTAITLRNIIGDLELDETLVSRGAISTRMQEFLDIVTGPWDIKVAGVKFKNIILPTAIQETMERQMKAERKRRESILRVEGEKKSTALVAEGHKESAVLSAEGEKEAAILAVETKKEKRIREAEGQVEVIRSVQKATANGTRSIKEAGADNTVLQPKNLEVFQTATNGKANKIIIPSDIQGVAGLIKSTAEAASKDEATG